MANRNSNAVFSCEYLVRLIAIVHSNSSRSEIMMNDNRTGVSLHVEISKINIIQQVYQFSSAT